MTSEQKGTGFSLKDALFNRDRVTYLGSLFHAADKSFDVSGFVGETMEQLTRLELKQRIVHIACVLEKHLSDDFPIAANQIVAALPPPLDPTKNDDDFGDFIFAPLGEFVVRNGLAKKHFKVSLRTLKEITQRFSMEDAIRALIDALPEETLKELSKWSTDKNYHVRRLVSEGTRPLLPWSGRLSIDATKPLPLLDALHADPTRYVTRSVSNHLNDIAKTKPKIVLETLHRWQQLGSQNDRELQWMCKHSLRTLVKQGDEQALQFLGYRPDPKIEITDLTLTPATLNPGDAVELSFTINALRDESLMVDYVIDFVKSNGKLKPKVHKLKQVEMRKGETVAIKKRHVLKANATTFTLYPGKHHITLQINGKVFGTKSFELN